MALTTTLLILFALQQPVTVGGGCNHGQLGGSSGPGPPSNTVGGNCNHAWHGGRGYSGPGDTQPPQEVMTPMVVGKPHFVSLDRMELEGGWIVDCAAPQEGKPRALRMFEDREAWGQQEVAYEQALWLPGAAMEQARFVGPFGDQKIVVGGVDTTGIGKFSVLQFAAPEPAIPGSEAKPKQRLGFQLTKFLIGDYAKETPVAITPLYGMSDHALVLTEPGGFLLDVYLGPGKGEAPRLLGTCSPTWFGGTGTEPIQVEITTSVHPLLGAEYRLREALDPGNCVLPFPGANYLDVNLDGNLVPGSLPLARPLSPEGVPQEVNFESTMAFRSELTLSWGLRPKPMLRGPVQAAAKIDSRDLLRTADGEFAELEVLPHGPGERRIALHWKRDGGPWRVAKQGQVPTHDRQTFALGGRVLTAAAVGPNLLLVSLHDEVKRTKRLELFSISPPVRHDGHGELTFQEPVHLRTVHAAPDFANESVIAIFQNHQRPMSAFVLMRATSTLCEVDLTQELGHLEVVLTVEQQPQLAGAFTHVGSSEWTGLGSVYQLDNRETDGWVPEDGPSVFLQLMDVNRDGVMDGRGFSSGRDPELAKLHGALAQEPKLLVYCGQPTD